MLKAHQTNQGARQPSKHISMLILVKCLCETAAKDYEALLIKGEPKKLSKAERDWIKKLHSDIATSHGRLGVLLASSDLH